MDFSADLLTLRAAASANRQRRTVVLWGGTRAQAEGLLAEVDWRALDRDAHSLLGDEIGALLVDLHEGLDPDALGAAVGAIRAGGLLCIVVPEPWPRDAWAQRLAVHPHSPEAVTDRFRRRFLRVLAADPSALHIRGDEASSPRLDAPSFLAEPMQGEALTADQAAAIELVVKVATGRRRRPGVIRSDRGRGKSSALGLAARRLPGRRILVTAPRPEAVKAVFEHGPEGLEFRAPGELLAGEVDADLVLVDEAAALPVPLLQKLLAHCPRVVFATTEHGYEGTGRGFALRFRKHLDAHARGWRDLELKTPIRYAEGDPVEALLFEALLMDAQVAPPAEGDFRVEAVDREALSEADLRGLFALLVQAHYRTTPSDLYRLLDSPNLRLFAAWRGGQPVGAALLAVEGGFDAAMCAEIFTGRRRPHGHLLPETLCAHAGLEAAPQLRGGRVVRIAVHPALQSEGIGSALLAHLRGLDLDYLGSAFGATRRLLRFWKANGYAAVRIGLKAGAASGERSAVVLHPLSEAGRRLCAQARAALIRTLPHLLRDPLRDLPAELAAELWAGPAAPPRLQTEDWAQLVAATHGTRHPDLVPRRVWRLACAAAADESASLESRALLITRCVQAHSWSATAAHHGLSGKPAALAAVRAALREAAERFGGESVKKAAARHA